MQPIPSIFPLVPKVMHYDWGNRGAASAVARLALPQAQIDAAKPYAELWMGTHPNAPSTALLPTSDPVDLLTLIRAHPTQLLGDALCHGSSSSGEEPHDLPFLFKVLSVAKPLSIQAHPDKHLARRLHVHSPQHYKDANHKPEMAIALTEFHALFGFRPSAEIVHHLRAYPELADVASEPAVNAFVAHVESGKPSDGSDNYNKQALRALFTAIMSASPTLVATHLTALITRLSSSPTSSPIDTLLLSTHAHFPNDVGLLCILLMNHVTLHPGQAMYMGANELHAYLSGDCIEVMATSDNVVRAGLTPKFKDVETLTSMLTYTQGGAGAGMLAPVAHAEGGGRVVVYDPPIEEFAVHRTEATSGEDVGVPVVHGPSVVLVTEGSGELRSAEGGDGPRVKVKPGSVVFVVPGTRVTLRAAEGGNGKVVVYQALCEAATPEKQQAGSKL